ncbi:hypothetical protein C5167_030609 [Papaver somniferum]|nr:hypothetical protein C5167_030609 [Papaver somniferum]
MVPLLDIWLLLLMVPLLGVVCIAVVDGGVGTVKSRVVLSHSRDDPVHSVVMHHGALQEALSGDNSGFNVKNVAVGDHGPGDHGPSGALIFLKWIKLITANPDLYY